MNYTTLLNDPEPVVAYDADFKGKLYFHIRKLYDNGSGTLQPGKGLAVPYHQKQELLTALLQLQEPQLRRVK